MRPARRRPLLYAALVALYLLHNDLWLWNDAGWFLGLPVGLAYHVLYCLAAAAMMALLVRNAWPSHLGVKSSQERSNPSAEGER